MVNPPDGTKVALHGMFYMEDAGGSCTCRAVYIDQAHHKSARVKGYVPGRCELLQKKAARQWGHPGGSSKCPRAGWHAVEAAPIEFVLVRYRAAAARISAGPTWSEIADRSCCR
jgi:hypothetical protein